MSVKTIKFQAPDGRIMQMTADIPDGASQDDIMAAAQQYMASQPKAPSGGPASMQDLMQQALQKAGNPAPAGQAPIDPGLANGGDVQEPALLGGPMGASSLRTTRVSHDQAKKILYHQLGGAAGLATGMGPIMSGLAATSTSNPGDLATIAAGGAAGKGMGALMNTPQLAQAGAGVRSLLQGGAGAAMNEIVNRLHAAANGQPQPGADPLGDIATGLVGAGHELATVRQIQNSPATRLKSFMQQVMGKALNRNEIEQLNPAQTLAPTQPNLVQAAAKVDPAITEAEEAKQQLSRINANKTKLQAKLDPRINPNITPEAQEKLENNLAKTEEALTRQTNAYKNARNMADNNPTLPPTVKQLVTAQTPTDFYKQLFSSEDAIRDYRNAIVGHSPEDLKTMQRAFTEDYLQRALDPRTGLPLHLNKSADYYNFNKVKEVFGGGEAGARMAQRFSDITHDISRISSSREFTQKWGGRALGTLGAYMMYHNKLTRPGRDSAIASGLATALYWPSIVDAGLRSPKFGDQFHDWAIHDFSQKYLQAVPLVKNFLDNQPQVKADAKDAVKDALPAGAAQFLPQQ